MNARRDRSTAGRAAPRGPSWRARLAAAAVLLSLCGLLMLLFSRAGGAAFPAYRRFSRGLMGLLATVAGVAPFALWDLLVLALVLAAVTDLVRRLRRRQPLAPLISRLCLLVASALFVFVGGWALNHYAPPLAAELDLEVDRSTGEELYEASAHYLERAARLAPEVPRDEDATLVRQDFRELAAIAGASYRPLSDRYEVFASPSAAPVKELLVWGEPLLYSGYVGIFWAPTGEAGVPLNCAPEDMPFVMCHEAAHRLGIASEREANFAAYLACDASEDPRFRYAGSLNAFLYCFGALVRTDPAAAQHLLDEAAASDYAQGALLVMLDRQRMREHYAAYEGGFQRVGEAVNDRYLKGFGEPAGVRSYGLVVDYLIAWYKASR